MVESDALQGFVGDVRGLFESTDDPIEQARLAADLTADLLSTPGWLEEEVDPSGHYRNEALYVDDDYGHPEAGFRFTTSVNDPDEEAPESRIAHDHGMAWVVYGVYKGEREQTIYRWNYDDDAPTLEAVDRYVQGPGEVAAVLPGAIHAQRTVGDERSWNFRLESRSMEGQPRHYFDVDEGTAWVG